MGPEEEFCTGRAALGIVGGFLANVTGYALCRVDLTQYTVEAGVVVRVSGPLGPVNTELRNNVIVKPEVRVGRLTLFHPTLHFQRSIEYSRWIGSLGRNIEFLNIHHSYTFLNPQKLLTEHYHSRNLRFYYNTKITTDYVWHSGQLQNGR